MCFFKAFLRGVSVKMVVFFFFLFFLGPGFGRGRMSSGEKGRVSSFEAAIGGPVESIDVLGFYCYC